MTQDLTTITTLKLFDYNDDTSIKDLVPIKNLKQLKTKMMKKMDYRL